MTPFQVHLLGLLSFFFPDSQSFLIISYEECFCIGVYMHKEVPKFM